MTGFEQLDVWKAGCRLAVEIYSALQKCRDHGLRDQMQRAAVSIPSNIAESSERQSKREFVQFPYIAKGSCAELRTQLYIAAKVNVMSLETVNRLAEDAKHVSSMLHKLIKTRLSPTLNLERH